MEEQPFQPQEPRPIGEILKEVIVDGQIVIDVAAEEARKKDIAVRNATRELQEASEGQRNLLERMREGTAVSSDELQESRRRVWQTEAALYEMLGQPPEDPRP